VGRTLPALVAELSDGDEVIVVDNASPDGTADLVRELAPAARVIDAGANLGFPAACNRGAEAARGELLVFLNPDAVPRPGWREAIAAPHAAGEWTAWQGLVTAEDGAVINTSGGVVHFTGIAWAGQAGQPVAEAAGGEPGFVSGACLAVPRREFELAGGFAGEFFLYHEDVDLSLRLRLAGGRLGVARDAVVDHDYEFAKGLEKWRHLERNRWATIIRTYPAGLLLLVWPALVATECALVPVALAGGWFRQQLLAKLDVMSALPRLLRERNTIQRRRRIGSREFAAALRPELSSPFLGRAAESGLLGSLLRGYWGAVLALLGSGRSV
jgi:N-acetylglucosaminyl-diphospho-decaprenol L-rhamnosyltransferase